MTLEEARKSIDDIDAQLIDLFIRRMEAVESVAEYKKGHKMNVFDQSREQLILDRVEALAPRKYASYAKSLHKYIMELSRSRQRDLLDSDDGDFPAHTVAPAEKPQVVVQGISGSYSSLAATRMYPDAQISFVETWDEVFLGIRDGTYDYGVLPIENSLAGAVGDVYGLLFRYKYNIVKSLRYEVNHCLLGIHGSSIENVKEIYSHPHAFPQCTDFLSKLHDTRLVPCLNTAVAARLVAKKGNPEAAAIASLDCAELFGLDVLAQSIQSGGSSKTRFISVSKRSEIHEDANKISLVFSLPHVTGSLYRALRRFALNGLNLTKIQSVPNMEKPFEYYFHIDFIGTIQSPETRRLLRALKKELPVFYFLGNYEEL